MRRILLVILFINQNWVFSHSNHLKIVKSWRGTGSIYAWSDDCIQVQFRIFPLKTDILQIGHLIPACVHILCAYTRKYFIRHLHGPLWLAAIGTCTKWLFKNSCLWDNNKLQAARGTSWELIAFSGTRSFTVKTTEPGPSWKDYSKTSLEAQKNMLLYCRLKVYEMTLEMSFWSTGSTSGQLTRLCHEWKNFCLFGTNSGVLDCDWQINFFKIGNGFRFSNSGRVFFVRQTNYLLVSGTYRENSAPESRLCTFYRRKYWRFR